jgi:transcription elongation factor Elf1
MAVIYDASDIESGELMGCTFCQSTEKVYVTTDGWRAILVCGECGAEFCEMAQ